MRVDTRAKAVAAYAEAARLARAHGVTVSFMDGWATRGREGLTVQRIVEHDTADPRITSRAAILNVLANGHGAIAGNSICGDAVMRDGEVVVVSAGLSWHAGSSNWRGLAGLNRWSLGTEYHRAQSQGLTDAQLSAGRIWTRARLQAFSIDRVDVCEHAECAIPAGRKGDRTLRPGVRLDGHGWRTSLTPLTPTRPDPEDEMTPAQEAKLDEALALLKQRDYAEDTRRIRLSIRTLAAALKRKGVIDVHIQNEGRDDRSINV